MKNKDTFEHLIKDLDSLYKRLKDNYNDGIEFEQFEEDRLVIYNVIEILEKTKKFVDDELKTYPINETLETISNYLSGDFCELE